MYSTCLAGFLCILPRPSPPKQTITDLTDLIGNYTFAPLYSFKTHGYFMNPFKTIPWALHTYTCLPYFFGALFPPCIRGLVLFAKDVDDYRSIFTIVGLAFIAIGLSTVAINEHYDRYQKLGRLGDGTFFWSTIASLFVFIPAIQVLAYRIGGKSHARKKYFRTFLLFLCFNLWEVFIAR